MTGGDIIMFAIGPYAQNYSSKINFGLRIDNNQIQLSNDPYLREKYKLETREIRQNNLVDNGSLASIFTQVLSDLGLIKGEKLTQEDINQISKEAENLRRNLDLVA